MRGIARLLLANMEIANLRAGLASLGTTLKEVADSLEAARNEQMPANIADKLGLERTAGGALQVKG